MTGSREALLRSGVTLIAERGYDAVTVGEIEAEAGFVPQGGTLCKHFTSKHAHMTQMTARGRRQCLLRYEPPRPSHPA